MEINRDCLSSSGLPDPKWLHSRYFEEASPPSTGASAEWLAGSCSGWRTDRAGGRARERSGGWTDWAGEQADGRVYGRPAEWADERAKRRADEQAGERFGGLALFEVLRSSFLTAFSGKLSIGAMTTFIITVADQPIANIGAPFWAIVFGLAVAYLFERPTMES